MLLPRELASASLGSEELPVPEDLLPSVLGFLPHCRLEFPIQPVTLVVLQLWPHRASGKSTCCLSPLNLGSLHLLLIQKRTSFAVCSLGGFQTCKESQSLEHLQWYCTHKKIEF